ncbi:hypothetical protein [Euzebya sp.]|uniref:hypothetical protein n=1 Tax=Euzebya sp. TaxID=1971409 RepID=UPI00351140A9
MTPTFAGRIQTRFFLLLVIAPLWTLIINFVLVPLVGGTGADMQPSYWVVYFNAIQVLVLTAVVGVLWEVLWHWMTLGRWEKDWPILYLLLQWIPEGIVMFFLVNPRWLGLTTDGGVPTSAFLVHYITTVLVTWTWVVGPHRMFFIRWRYEGGRLV